MKFGKLLQRALVTGAVGALLCLGLPVQAGTLNASGFTKGSELFDLMKGVDSYKNTQTGGFSGTFDGNPIQFWCAELEQHFNFHVDYDYTASIPNNAVFTRLGELFHEAYGTGAGQALFDTNHSAAFQLAIWEILFDGTNLDLGTGNFKVTNNHNHNTTITIAQTWLSGLGSIDDYDITLLHNDSKQDFIYGTRGRLETPEPTPLALLGAGLVAMILASRRRTPKVAPG